MEEGMSRYEVILSVVVEAEDSDEAYKRALAGDWYASETLVEEDGIRILPDPIFALTDKGKKVIES
jgi:hypothetical protein